MNVIISGIQSVYEDVYLLVFQGISKKKKDSSATKEHMK